MKILIVSYNFPPENVIGAVRVGKLAKYLHERGHDVRVLSAPPGGDTSLPIEIPTELVHQAKDWNIDELLDPVVTLFRRRRQMERGLTVAVGNKPSPPSASANGTRLRERLRAHYYALLRVPDARAGWLKNAKLAGRALVSHWRPDIIFASAPPVTSLFVAAALGKRFRIPWIADLRDLWVENPYYPFPSWRRVLDGILEKRVLGHAAMLVTVTPHGGQTLKKKYNKPVSVILNGYEEEDASAALASKEAGTLSIAYTGSIYRGFRDPSPLFAAISKLTEEERRSLRIDFYGPSIAPIRDLMSHEAVSDCVTIQAPVTYLESLKIQRNADVLLLLGWNDSRDAGNVPAKFFEYIAAGRPILFLGYETGTLATMIRERNAGLVSNDPARISVQLSHWISLRQRGPIPALANSVRTGLSRQEQFQKLEALLSEFVSNRR